MADLGTLRPGAEDLTGLPTTGSIIVLPGGSTALSDDSDSTFDSQASNASGTYQYGRALDNPPGDFASILTCSVQLRRAWASAVSNSTWDSLSARIMASDGTTVLAALNSGGAFKLVSSSITDTTPTNSSVVAFDYVNTGATKTQWDGAILQMQWVRTRAKGGDSVGANVYEAFVTGTYTASAGPTPQALPATTTLTPSIARRLTWARSLPVASTHAPAMTRFLAAFRTLTPATSFAPAQGRQLALFRALAVAPSFSGGIGFLRLVNQALVASSALVPALAERLTWVRTIAVASTFSANLAKVLNVPLAVTSTFAASLTRVVVYNVPLAVASTFSAGFRRLISMTFAVTSTFAASSAKRIDKLLAVGASMSAGVASVLNLSLSVSATFAVGLTRRALYGVPLSVTATLAPALLRMIALQIGVASVVSVALGRDFYVTLALTSTLAPLLLRDPPGLYPQALPTASTFASGLATLFIPAGGPPSAISRLVKRLLLMVR